jgi:hypothetical protein
VSKVDTVEVPDGDRSTRGDARALNQGLDPELQNLYFCGLGAGDDAGSDAAVAEGSATAARRTRSMRIGPSGPVISTR